MCGICEIEFPSVKKLNDHASIVHPISNLVCNDTTCEYKTNTIQALKDHKKEMHERNVCKDCNTITVGSAHKANHEKTTHGKEAEITHLHSHTEAPAHKKGMGTTEKTFINRKVKKLQLEVNELNKVGNIYNKKRLGHC